MLSLTGILKWNFEIIQLVGLILTEDGGPMLTLHICFLLLKTIFFLTTLSTTPVYVTKNQT